VVSRPGITAFDGPYFFLSNFYYSPVEWEGELYSTVEHAFQAAKTLRLEERQKIQLAPTPALAKQLGRRVTLRSDWETIKIEVMRDLLAQKFSDPDLEAQLLATKDAELIEGNTWGDRIWGCVLIKGVWQGHNHLGKLLMETRAALLS